MANGLIIECENLYWGESPYQLYHLLSNKSVFDNETVEYLESTKTPLALYVNFNFENVVIDKEETIFFPLSFTHEWGHFIGDVSNVDEENVKQVARFVTFVNKEESTPLFGAASVLDSVDLVNLLLSVEELLEDELDIEFVIANEKALSQKNSPFKTVATLAQYLTEEINSL